jgi:serine/threonine-protein kinase
MQRSSSGALDPTLSRLGGGRPGGEMDILRYATALCEGLEAGHSAGYVHGRLVPSDIVEVAGQIKISGIGLYRGLDPILVSERWGDLRRYLAPEVLESGAATPRSDVYSMGAILAELASGMAHRDLHETVELLAGDQGALADVLARAVARSADKRPGRPAELLGLVRRLYVDSRATIDRGDVPLESTPTTLPRFDEDDLSDKTIEESSPLFKDRRPRQVAAVRPQRADPARPPRAAVPAADRGVRVRGAELAETVMEQAPVPSPDARAAPRRPGPGASVAQAGPRRPAAAAPVVPAIDRPTCSRSCGRSRA